MIGYLYNQKDRKPQKSYRKTSKRPNKKKPYRLKKEEQVLSGMANIYVNGQNPTNRAASYWKSKGLGTRLGKQLVQFGNDPLAIEANIKQWGFNSVEFGKWLSNDDSINYFVAFLNSISTLRAITGFHDHHMGLNNYVGISFGARGRGGKSLAHFEPANGMINITRYSRKDKKNLKAGEFYTTGGVGSLAHEYGHALDYYFGLYDGKESDSSAGCLSDPNFNGLLTGELRGAMKFIILAITKNAQGKENGYMKRLKRKFSGKTLQYYTSPAELFARAFEVWVSRKFAILKSRDVQPNNTDPRYLNTLLVKPIKKYEDSAIYLHGKEADKVCKLIDELILKMRKRLTLGVKG